MFAGMPGTGIGALFFALVCISISLVRGVRRCGWISIVSAIWIACCVLLIYGHSASAWLNAEQGQIGFSFMPLVLLTLVLALAALAAKLIVVR